MIPASKSKSGKVEVKNTKPENRQGLQLIRKSEESKKKKKTIKIEDKKQEIPDRSKEDKSKELQKKTEKEEDKKQEIPDKSKENLWNKFVVWCNKHWSVFTFLMLILTILLIIITVLLSINFNNEGIATVNETNGQNTIIPNTSNSQDTNKEPLSIYTNPENDYCDVIGKNMSSMESYTRRLSIHENETYTLTLVNNGDDIINIKNIGGRYECESPQVLGKPIIDAPKIELDNNVLRANEKTSTAISMYLNENSEEVIDKIETFDCKLKINVRYSYKEIEFNEVKHETIFKWSKLTSEELIKIHSCYKPSTK